MDVHDTGIDIALFSLFIAHKLLDISMMGWLLAKAYSSNIEPRSSLVLTNLNWNSMNFPSYFVSSRIEILLLLKILLFQIHGSRQEIE